MYSVQRVEVPKPLDRMYSTSTASLKEEPKEPSKGKKDTMLQSMLNAFNVIWEHFSKVPSNLMANLNNPLSVTVVQNEGIISNEFFKGLTTRGGETVTKQSLNIVESIHCTILDDAVCKSNYEALHLSNLRGLGGSYETTHIENKYESVEIIEEDEIEIEYSELDEFDIISGFTECSEYNSLVPYYNKLNQRKNCLDAEEFFCKRPDKKMVTDMRIVAIEDDKVIFSETKVSCEEPIVDKNSTAEVILNPYLASHLTLCMFPQITKRLFKTQICAKKEYPKGLIPKVHFLSYERKRFEKRNQKMWDEMRTQRYKKERIKQEMKTGIREDLEILQDLEGFQEERFDVNPDEDLDEYELETQELRKPITFTITDLKPKFERRQRKALENPEFFHRINYQDCREKCGLEIGTIVEEKEEEKESPQDVRARLLSESSVDSEDSYCIVFETEPELNYWGEFDLEEESSEEEDEEDEEESDVDVLKPKVKFDLKPRVHVMVQWDYAYRAARKGPWEEMARDRERFKGRINSIERVLRPVLTSQHRHRIWQQRFEQKC